MRKNPGVGVRGDRLKRALHVGRVARRTRLLRVLREVGVAGERPATPEAAREFRLALEELGTTYVKLGQLLSSRPDLLPDVYIEELTRLVDEVPPVPFAELEPVIRRSIGESAFARHRRDAAGRRLDRADPPGAAGRRAGGGREGSPAGRRGAGGRRSRPAAIDGGLPRAAVGKGADASALGARRGSRASISGLSSTSPRRPTTRSWSGASSTATPTCSSRRSSTRM